MPLYRLIYVSSASHQMSDAELQEILESAASHNTSDGITGMLLYADGNFMQVLEGEEAVIDATFARICEDRRHHDVLLIEKEPIEKRDFPTWAMGFRKLTSTEIKENSAFIPFIKGRFDPQQFGVTPGIVARILKEFGR